MNYYEIFRECFPQLRLSEKQFISLSGFEQCRLFTCGNGYALVSGNKLRLICVPPQEQKKGTGTELLRLAEDHVRNQGFTRMEIGDTGSGLFIGAVEESVPFFEKHGYSFGERIAEMSSGRNELLLNPADIPGVSFEIRQADERVRNAVKKVDPEWVQYFTDGEVMCAVCGENIAAFCILEEDVFCVLSDETSRMGSIGCVGTVPEFRRRRIGLEMVKRASAELLERGSDRIFIHYTGVYDWYAKLGYHTDLWLRLGGKEL